MKKVQLGNTQEKVSAIAMGCMRINNIQINEAVRFIENALNNEVNFFDHADIYGNGKCEELFGKALAQTSIKREDIFVQTKCGIVPSVMYDLSKKHIISSVDKSLKRLGMDYVDALLLHRPDALVEPEEVAEAFDKLYRMGKVRHFGVSNHKPMQIELLKKYVKQPLEVNQLQLSATNATMISNGLEVNMHTEGSLDRDGSVLDYCRLNNMTIQAWSPFQYGMFGGVFLNSEEYASLNNKLQEIGNRYNVSATTMAVAWILRHPANMQVLAGTMNKIRFDEICKATEISITREEWYEIYMAAGNMLP